MATKPATKSTTKPTKPAAVKVTPAKLRSFAKALGDMREIYEKLGEELDDCEGGTDNLEALSRDLWTLAGRAEQIEDEASYLSNQIREALGLELFVPDEGDDCDDDEDG